MLTTDTGSDGAFRPTRATMLDDLAAQYQPSLVARWDDLIDWDKRRASERDFFVDALRRTGGRRVLDAATGTGFHSILLANAGFDVTSVDGSAEMLKRAVANAAARGIPLRAIQSDWRDIGRGLAGGFDAVLCLGSSFPHLFDAAGRRDTLAAFHAALKPGGLLILDHRNFDAIRARRYKSSGHYYYCGTDVSVSIDHIDADLCRFRYDFPDRASYKLEVYPVLKEEARDLMSDAGFAAIETYGDFRTDFDPATSDFFIHIARKPLRF